MKKLCLALIVVLIALILILFSIKPKTISTETIEVVRNDTIIQIDTVRDTIPKYKTQQIVDTLYIPYFDGKDTTKISLPITERTYKTESYHAIVRGYEPMLEYIETYNKEVFVDREQIKTVYRDKRWSFGINVSSGYGLTTKKPDVFVGAGITYNIVTW